LQAVKISPFIFVLVKNGCLILWDYKLHNQFEISTEYLDELCHFETARTPCNQQIFSELVENNIIVREDNSDYFDSGWQWDELAKIFHIGTQDVNDEILSPAEYSRKYLDDCEKNFSAASSFDYCRTGDKIELPVTRPTEIENAKLIETLLARRTCRNFNSTPISFENIATLLKVTFAVSNRDEDHYRSLGLLRVGQRKTSPSGGSLHPSEAYLFVQNVEGLEKGIYHFNSTECHLTKVEAFDRGINISDFLDGQYFANNLSAGVFITSVFEKQWWKYKHSRAYRVALLDAGHISQTLLLSATALGLSTWISGAFNDTKVSKILKIETINERPLLFIGLGYGHGSSVDTETMKILESKKL
jgi:SagB-type dehydrogenase family enzyme